MKNEYILKDHRKVWKAEGGNSRTKDEFENHAFGTFENSVWIWIKKVFGPNVHQQKMTFGYLTPCGHSTTPPHRRVKNED